MTAINLPGQRELPIVVDHNEQIRHAHQKWISQPNPEPRDVQLAKLLRSYEDRPSSETWSRIQTLAKEILKWVLNRRWKSAAPVTAALNIMPQSPKSFRM